MLTRRLSVVTLGLTVAGMLMVVAPGAASACSCMIRPLADRLSAADVVFLGTPTNGDEPEGAVSSADPVRWTFHVDAVHKGAVTRTVNVLSALDSASCGIPFEVNNPYLVFGVINGDAVTAGLCGGTERLDQIPADVLASLGDGAAPAVQNPPGGSTGGPSGASSDSWRAPLLIAAGAALVLGLGLVALRRRSHPDPPRNDNDHGSDGE